jgi:hypothetical protein
MADLGLLVDNLTKVFSLNEGIHYKTVDHTLDFIEGPRQCYLTLTGDNLRRLVNDHKMAKKKIVEEYDNKIKQEDLEKGQLFESVTKEKNKDAEQIKKEGIIEINSVLMKYKTLLEFTNEERVRQYGAILASVDDTVAKIDELGLKETAKAVIEFKNVIDPINRDDVNVQVHYNNVLATLGPITKTIEELPSDFRPETKISLKLIGDDILNAVYLINDQNVPQSLVQHISALLELTSETQAKVKQLDDRALGQEIENLSNASRNKIELIRDELSMEKRFFDKQRVKAEMELDNLLMNIKTSFSKSRDVVDNSHKMMNEKINNDLQQISQHIFLATSGIRKRTSDLNLKYDAKLEDIKKKIALNKITLDKQKKSELTQIIINHSNIKGYCWIRINVNDEYPYIPCDVQETNIVTGEIVVLPLINLMNQDHRNRYNIPEGPYRVKFDKVCSDSGLKEYADSVKSKATNIKNLSN